MVLLYPNISKNQEELFKRFEQFIVSVMNRKTGQLLKNKKVEMIKGFLSQNEKKTLLLTGLYSSAKAYAIAESVESGIHLVILNNREDASGCINDLYNLMGDESVFFFPPLGGDRAKGSVREVSSKVQRTSVISVLSDYKRGVYGGDNLIIVGYADSFGENIPSQESVSESVITICKGEALPFDKVIDTLYAIGFERVDFVSGPGSLP